MGGAPARAPGGCVFEEQVGVGVHNARVSESTDDLWYKQACPSEKREDTTCQMGLKKMGGNIC